MIRSPGSLTSQLLSISCLMLAGIVQAQDLNTENERAIKAAVRMAAPWVVKIDTAGGQEVIGAAGQGPGRRPAPVIRKGIGPTTGLIVSSDGYIISSAFNFANKPTDIFVTVPGHPRKVAKIVATDTTRMVTLLKADLTGLPVPQAVPKSSIQVGQWAIALGRAIDPDLSDMPSISVGIISATGRIWGKALQTDAKVSPTNYGGPLIAIDGRVFGVLVPASPQGDGETAGVEWYDSGIGFAIPLEDIFAILPRFQQGKDLRRGLLGITPQQANDAYNLPLVVGSVANESAAAKAGIKPGDTIVEVDGVAIANFSQLQHRLGPKYEGDRVRIVVLRDGKRIELGEVTLSGSVTAYNAPYLGILPMRDDPEPGVEIRYVFPKSPAAAANCLAGDRIMKVGPPGALPGLPAGAGGPGVAVMSPVNEPSQLQLLLSRFTPGQDVKLELKRKSGKIETVTVKLAAMESILPEELPLPSSKGRALERPKPPTRPKPMDGAQPGEGEPAKPEKTEPSADDAAETGLLKKTHGVLGREYWLYLPRNYDKNVAHGLIVWLHTSGKGGKDAEDMVKFWGDFCEKYHFLIVGPKSRNDDWVASESEEISQILKELLSQYTIDRQRVIAHGMGVGGQMAFYLGFHLRDLIRGVATTGAALGNPPKDVVPNQPLSFFIVAGEKDPMLKEIEESKAQLEAKKYPVQYRAIPEFGKEYLTLPIMQELQRWMDSLDRI